MSLLHNLQSIMIGHFLVLQKVSGLLMKEWKYSWLCSCAFIVVNDFTQC